MDNVFVTRVFMGRTAIKRHAPRTVSIEVTALMAAVYVMKDLLGQTAPY